jgi:hypothetical protein
MLPLPAPSVTGIFGYLALAAGLAIGFAILNPIAGDIQNSLKKGGA